MNLRIKTSGLLLLTAFMILNTCSLPSDPEESGALAAEFTSFQLTTEDNPSLPASVSGTFDDDKILLKYPDTMIPGFRWIPRFDTEAVSIEIEGQPQYSGTGAVDFSTPVTYTLTSSSGQIKKVTVELVLDSGWRDMGVNPVVPPITGTYNIRTGLMVDVNPYVACFDASSDLKVYALGIPDGVWSEYNVSQPSGVIRFDTLSWDSQIWAVYETTIGTVEAQLTVPPDTWSGIFPLTATSGTKDLQAFNGSEDRIFAAWIEDPSAASTPVVWTGNSTGIWVQVGGAMTSFHADSMAAVSAGGTELYVVCTLSENPGTLNMYKYRDVEDDWLWIMDGGELFKEEDQRVVDLFYDTEKQAPVVFTILPSNEDAGFYEVRALYWSDSAKLWTNLGYIQPLMVNAASIPSLSISWYEDTPSIAAGSSVLTWKERRWQSVGSEYTSDTPAIQSLTTGVMGTYFAAYTTDPASGEMRVRMIQ